MFSFLKRKATDYFSLQNRELIANAIAEAEKKTSGEIRVYVESELKTGQPLDRAKELFDGLNMFATEEHNGVLVYIAIKSRKLAIYADEGIYRKLGQEYWDKEVSTMLFHFNRNDYVDGIITIVHDIGAALSEHFPYDKKGDINELPNDVVFGK
ncbi:MAG: TPM domain-containing protein [Chitinophagaceae bacterium]